MGRASVGVGLEGGGAIARAGLQRRVDGRRFTGQDLRGADQHRRVVERRPHGRIGRRRERGETRRQRGEQLPLAGLRLQLHGGVEPVVERLERAVDDLHRRDRRPRPGCRRWSPARRPARETAACRARSPPPSNGTMSSLVTAALLFIVMGHAATVCRNDSVTVRAASKVGCLSSIRSSSSWNMPSFDRCSMTSSPCPRISRQPPAEQRQGDPRRPPDPVWRSCACTAPSMQSIRQARNQRNRRRHAAPYRDITVDRSRSPSPRERGEG